MESPQQTSGLSVRGWSAVVGATQSKIVDLLITNAVNVALVVGTVCLLAPTHAAWDVVGGVLCLAALLLVGWLLQRDARRQSALLNSFATQRLVLVVAVAAGYLVRRPDDPGWIWVAAGLATMAVLSEPTIKVLLSKTQPVAVQLPGVPPVPTPPFQPGLLALVTLGYAALGGLLAVVGAPGWSLTILGLAVAAATLTMVSYAARANVVAKRSAAGVPAALTKYAPAFAVYYGAVQGATYQLGMWLPYLERLQKPYVVITRNPVTVPAIRALTDAPIIVPRLNSVYANLDDLVVPSLKAAFYVQGSANNLTFQRYRQLTHIWLNHGDSDKQANFAARHATYDKLFVSGRQGVERYAAHGVNVPPERFVIVGRPQIERIEVRDEPLPPDAPRTVLYAPTWQGGRPATNYSSLPLGDKIVDGLLARGATVIFRPHPLSYKDPLEASVIARIHHRLEADRSSTGRQHVWGERAEREWDIPACFNHCDALVTDVSSVASDFLASGKPLAMVAIRSGGKAFRKEFPMARVSYVIEKNLSTLAEAIDHFWGDDPLAEQRRAYRTYCLGEKLGPEAPEEFLRVAGEIVAGRR